MNDTAARIMEAMLCGEPDRKDAALYVAYRRLERDGYFRACLDEKQPGAQRKRYVITGVGAKRRRQGGKARRKHQQDRLREG